MSLSDKVVPNKRKGPKSPAQRGQHALSDHDSISDSSNERHRYYEAIDGTRHPGMPQFRPSPLRRLLAKYSLLDAISHVKADIVNSCLDQIRSEPPSRPLAESITSFNASTPRLWLGIRKMIRNYYTDVLHTVLDIVYAAISLSNHVLLHTPSDPILSLAEQRFATPTLFDGIRARKHVLRILYGETQAFIDKVTKLPQKEAGGGDLVKPLVSPTAVNTAASGCDIRKWYFLIMSRYNSLRHSGKLIYCILDCTRLSGLK